MRYLITIEYLTPSRKPLSWAKIIQADSPACAIRRARKFAPLFVRERELDILVQPLKEPSQ